jgi:hypothetical protein
MDVFAYTFTADTVAMEIMLLPARAGAARRNERSRLSPCITMAFVTVRGDTSKGSFGHPNAVLMESIENGCLRYGSGESFGGQERCFSSCGLMRPTSFPSGSATTA